MIAVLLAVYGLSLLLLAVLLADEVRTSRRAKARARAYIEQAQQAAVSWCCPHCDDVVTTATLMASWAGATEHLALCAFYRASGSWEASSR
jgi:hypothetical protein